MKNYNRGFVGLIVLIIIGLIAIAGTYHYYVKARSEVSIVPVVGSNDSYKPANKASTQSNTATEVKPAALKTYTNAQYGFSLESDAVETGNYRSLHPFTALPVAYISVGDAGDGQTEGYLTVNVSSEAADVAHCVQPEAVAPSLYTSAPGVKLTNTSSATINGVVFARSDWSDGGNVNGLRRDYSVLHNGLCYNIELSSFPSACVNSGCENKKWSLETETVVLGWLDKFAQSFKFTR